VDQRLVRDGFIEHRSAEALALYLFLITVGDAQGLSYYSDPTLCGVIGFSPSTLQRARSELQRAQLIAYQKPLYQVLSLGCSKPAKTPVVSNPGSKNPPANACPTNKDAAQQIISRLAAQIGNIR